MTLRAAVTRPTQNAKSQNVDGIEETYQQATTWLKAGEPARAAAAFDRILLDDPLHFPTLVHGGVACFFLGDEDGAALRLRAALALDPASLAALVNLANAERRRRPAAAIAVFRHALRLDPMQETAARRAALCLNLTPASPEETLAAARTWAAAAFPFSAPSHPPAAFASLRDHDPGRRLRVGYLVEYILTHDYTCLPLVENHSEAIEVVVYALSKPLFPDIEARYRTAAATFRTTPGISHDDLADLIRRDGVDILVEGAGLASIGGRLAVLARRAAPIQIHFPVMSTTGMAAVDEALADPIIVPAGGEGGFAETVRRVPLAYHFNPLTPTPEPTAPPSLRQGFITFGCFNSLSKTNDAVLQAWGRLLAAVPQSRLIIKATDWTPAAAQAMRDALTGAYGVDPGRLDVRRPTPTIAEHYAAFSAIGIALGTVPYGGVTTTAQALWMGAPVATLAGRRPLERYGAALLTAVGLHDLIAADVDG